jgi:thiamine biosynthesis lipoprotein
MLLETTVTGFRAMGTDCEVHVTAVGDAGRDLSGLAIERIELLEQSWSRFRPTSELNRLNERAGAGPVPVSEDLLHLVQRMHGAWHDTDGLFDPTVLASMTALGYDTDFAAVASRPATHWQDVVTAPAPGMSAVVIDRADSTVALPLGIGLDPGAIGKGLAADIVAEELLSAGAHRVLVNLGGDIAVAGPVDDGTPWHIGVEDERARRDSDERLERVLEVAGPRAGIATSTTMKRRWAQGRRHHVIDPRTGNVSTGDLAQVTVVADSASEAEVLATAALLLPSTLAAAWLADRTATAVLMLADRTATAVLLTDEDVLVANEGDAHV